MGLLVDGKWQDTWYDTKSTGGKFVRKDAAFRNWVTANGDAGPTGRPGFKADAGRYHLYVSLACPWAHRTLIMSALKGLESMIDVTVVDPDMLENGWELKNGSGPAVEGASYLYQVYQAAMADYTGRVTVPVLWDTHTQTIVSNESSEIIRMFNIAFDGVGAKPGDYYPAPLREEIDAINERVYHSVNNGVYKCGFATSQGAYEDAFDALFDGLEWMEGLLSTRRYLAGDVITEADIRAFTTLVRFDAVYVGHFKCNKNRIADYPNLQGYVKELYQLPGVAQTVNVAHIMRHYYYSHDTINPTRVIPAGPELDFESPHGRDNPRAA